MSGKIARVVTAISFAVVLVIVLVIVPSAERRERERTVAGESSTPVYKIYPYALGDSSIPGIYPIGSKLCLRAAAAADGYWWTAPSSADRESFSWYCDDPRVWNGRVVVSVFLSFLDTKCNTKGCPVRKVEFNFYPDEDDGVDVMSAGSGFVPNHYRRHAASEDHGKVPQRLTPDAESFRQPTPSVPERHRNGAGVGSDTGGDGPGEGGGTFRAGVNGVGVPVCIYCPPPLYSDGARKAKYMGSVVLQVTVTADGRAVNISIVKDPGMGLGEKAVESVRAWRFRPAAGPNGKIVPVTVPIEVTFRLY